MQLRPLSIPGLPLASPIRELMVPEDTTRATSSHPRRPIPPHPIWSIATPPAAAVAAVPLTVTTAATVAVAATVENPGRSARMHPSGGVETQASQHRPRPQTTVVARSATAAAAAANAAAPIVLTPASSLASELGDGRPLFPLKHYPKSAPRYFPVKAEAPVYPHHPLAIRTPLDVFRFFPMLVSGSALFAGLSGLLAGKMVHHSLGGDGMPIYFAAGYLAIFLLSLLLHYFSSKGHLFFTCSQRFMRLLAVNALVLAPHFIAYTILMGVTEK